MAHFVFIGESLTDDSMYITMSSDNWGHLSDTEITYLLRVWHTHVTKTVIVHLRIRISHKCKPSQYQTLLSTAVYGTRRPTPYVIRMQPTYSRWPQILTDMIMWYRGLRFRDCILSVVRTVGAKELLQSSLFHFIVPQYSVRPALHYAHHHYSSLQLKHRNSHYTGWAISVPYTTITVFLKWNLVSNP